MEEARRGYGTWLVVALLVLVLYHVGILIARIELGRQKHKLCFGIFFLEWCVCATDDPQKSDLGVLLPGR